jgi:hypothetical protein
LQIEKYATRAKLEPFSAIEVAEMKATCDALVARFGDEMHNEYGWASKASNNPRPTFAFLEESVGLDHWRPFYRWASQHTHAPHRPVHSYLGTSESQQEVMLVGQSNSGLTDPLQMTGLSLALVTANLILHEPLLDHLVIAKIIEMISAEIGPTAIKLQRDTLRRARKREKLRR